jgi:hypothetical protein
MRWEVLFAAGTSCDAWMHVVWSLLVPFPTYPHSVPAILYMFMPDCYCYWHAAHADMKVR